MFLRTFEWIKKLTFSLLGYIAYWRRPQKDMIYEWIKTLPEVNGTNEKDLWIHVELVSKLEQRKKQKEANFKVHNTPTDFRLPEITLILHRLIKQKALFICYCDLKTKHTHFIMLWLDWIKLSPFLKQNIDWGDKYEYYQEEWPNFTDGSW